MQLIVQPRDGIEPLLAGIKRAQERIEIIIYRLDRLEIEQALVEAAWSGIYVHALITYTNREDLKEIKKLERRLTLAGVKVTRTAEDLLRYHAKLMIIDRRELFLLTFNFTFLDIHHSRSFGVVTADPALVREAVRLFEADLAQKRPKPAHEAFVVSPINARERLTEFILGARAQLLIYDGKLSDAQMIRHLEAQAKAGVDITERGFWNGGIEVLKSWVDDAEQLAARRTAPRAKRTARSRT